MHAQNLGSWNRNKLTDETDNRGLNLKCDLRSGKSIQEMIQNWFMMKCRSESTMYAEVDYSTQNLKPVYKNVDQPNNDSNPVCKDVEPFRNVGKPVYANVDPSRRNSKPIYAQVNKSKTKTM